MCYCEIYNNMRLEVYSCPRYNFAKISLCKWSGDTIYKLRSIELSYLVKLFIQTSIFRRFVNVQLVTPTIFNIFCKRAETFLIHLSHKIALHQSRNVFITGYSLRFFLN